MDFNFKMFNWNNEGAEPSDDLKSNGFKQGYKPAAGIFNRFWHLVTNAITELQTKFGAHAENKENPHGVSAAQVGLDKVNNTADSEKSVKFASEAGVGRKVENALSVRFNGGKTEGTDLWTFDGSTSRSVNITPKNIKAAEEVHTHETTDINGLQGAIDKIVAATSTDGVTYTATVEGITELYEGLEITICPDTSNTSNTMTLNVNRLGAKPIRRPLSFSTYVADSAKSGFLHKDAPCRLMYHAEYPNRVDGVSGDGIWLMADKVKVSAQDLYGTVPIESGGTGASDYDEARKNLGISNVVIIESYPQLTENSSELELLDEIPSGKTASDIFAVSMRINMRGDEGICQGLICGGEGTLTGALMGGKVAEIYVDIESDGSNFLTYPQITIFDINTGAKSTFNLAQIQSADDFSVLKAVICFK